ncbi:hypothetical protein QJQ45_000257 [Haematococcus lacustris]|nr:hypothetical protein QJQ45_000257 [Haematococcus lacustris]
MLSDVLQRFPGMGSAVYLHLDADSRRAMRLVCKQLRAAIDDSVRSLDIVLKDSDEPDEVLQRLARTSLRPSKLYLGYNSEKNTQSTLLAVAMLAQELVPILHRVQDLTLIPALPLSAALVDEGSLAACTQLTTLRSSRWLPALTQLTQLQQLKVNQDLASDSLPLLATLPQLTDLGLRFCPLQPSSQLSRFLFQHLTYLSVSSIHSRDLAALDCPQLQTLTMSQLQVDCAASLHACAKGILHNCSSIYELFTYNHGQEFESAAAGAEVRQLGPPPSASVLLEALAPWQPRSGKAILWLGLCHLPDVTREALEWLPVNIRTLRLTPATPLPSNSLARGPPQPSPLPTPLAQLSSTCLVQLLWAFASHEHCQAALLRAAAPVLSARILQGQLSSRRVACVAWAYARLQQLEPRLFSTILRTGGRPGLSAAGGSGSMAAQSRKAIEKVGRQHLVAWTCEALERLPFNPSP